MAENKKTRTWHINNRISLRLILLMIVVFTSVFLASNLFIRSYIRSNVDAQLSGLVNNMPKHFEADKNRGPMGPDDQRIPDLSGQPKSKVGAKGEVFVVSADYAVADFIKDDNREETAQIAAYLKEKAVPLGDARSVSVKTAEGEYYISTIPDSLSNDSFLVLYVNVSVLNNLVRTINTSLAIILVIALLFSLLIANNIARSITTPVKKISDFSREIGKGNFARSHLEFQDIEFNELVAEMNDTAEKLEQYDSEQKIFFQNVSHELRTPLMSIRCHAEGIAYGLMDKEKSGTTIITETDRLSALVEDLLYISRMDSTKNKVEMTENDIRETISMASAALQPVADKKGLAVEFQFDSSPVLFTYNENDLYRAILNLISNGIRYAKSTIILSCHQSADEITLSVTDDGEGISPEELPHIFERFYKGKGGKHGVGLSIVKAVVEIHGGKIAVNQTEGTRFTITFPKNK